MTSADTVTVAVTELIPARGRGRLKYTAVVTLEIAGIELTLQGVAVMADPYGRLTVTMPQTRHPGFGAWFPAVGLPLELHRAIEREVLALVPGARVYTAAAPHA